MCCACVKVRESGKSSQKKVERECVCAVCVRDGERRSMRGEKITLHQLIKGH